RLHLCAIPLFLSSCNDTTTSDFYTLSLHDALPISGRGSADPCCRSRSPPRRSVASGIVSLRLPYSCSVSGSLSSTATASSNESQDRKSTRLNSSHVKISYAVFCLKKQIYCQKNIYQ